MSLRWRDRSGGDHRRRGRRRLHAARRAPRPPRPPPPRWCTPPKPRCRDPELRSTPPAARAARRPPHPHRAWRWSPSWRGSWPPRPPRRPPAPARTGRRPSGRYPRPAVPPAPVLLARHRAWRAPGRPVRGRGPAPHQPGDRFPASVSSLRACAPPPPRSTQGEHHVEVPNHGPSASRRAARNEHEPEHQQVVHHRPAAKARARSSAAAPRARFRSRHPVLTALVPVGLVVAAVATMIVVKAAGTSGPSAAASSHLTQSGLVGDRRPGHHGAVAERRWPRSRPAATLDAVGSPSSVVLPEPGRERHGPRGERTASR